MYIVGSDGYTVCWLLRIFKPWVPSGVPPFCFFLSLPLSLWFLLSYVFFCPQTEIGSHLNSGPSWAYWANAEVLSGTLEVVLWNRFSHLLPGTPGAKAQPSVAELLL